MKTILLDAGHGGLINGVYQTAGKRSPRWPDGSILYEGEFNRAIKARVMEELAFANIPFVDINPEHEDISLKERVRRANSFKGESIFASIHANGGGGTGCEVFHARKASLTSMRVASIAQENYKYYFEEYDLRWRGIKKKDFYVLKNTKMPAILFECPFMDNQEDCDQWLLSKSGRQLLSWWIFDTLRTAAKL